MSRHNALRGKLNNSLVAGTYVTFSDSVVSQVLGYTGYDFVWIDTEHTPVDYQSLRSHLDSLRLAGTASVVRVGEHEPAHVKRVLDMGPDGIIFPMINTAEDAKRAMDLCIYPPEGRRGFGPLRAVDYYFDSTEEYIRNHRENLVRFVQIETEEAVRNLPEIMKNPYIDGYIIGPGDLSGSVGELGNVFAERNLQLIKRAVLALKGANKPVGVATFSSDPKELAFWYGMGFNIISSGVDFAYLRHGAERNLAVLKDLARGEKNDE